MAARILTEAAPHMQHMWVPMLAMLAILSIVIGNLAAIMQQDIRCMLVLLFSMAGIPPFAGFWAKWLVLTEALQAGYIKLAIFAVLCSVAGAFYYLRIIRLMYFEPPQQEQEQQPEQQNMPTMAMTVVTINTAAVLVLGLIPNGLLQLCINSFT